eukprot:GABV01010952.1.p1 GENE.GABV01010952.1~~GABV01010952.1.p1  ORF type:complete len:131 (+),score=47.84 GABV01010952.1:2-394(+)
MQRQTLSGVPLDEEAGGQASANLEAVMAALLETGQLQIMTKESPDTEDEENESSDSGAEVGMVDDELATGKALYIDSSDSDGEYNDETADGSPVFEPHFVSPEAAARALGEGTSSDSDEEDEIGEYLRSV